MWSPANAPNAAHATTSGTEGAPCAANTPATMTALSLGNAGRNPSSHASRNSTAYTQGEPMVSRSACMMVSVNDMPATLWTGRCR